VHRTPNTAICYPLQPITYFVTTIPVLVIAFFTGFSPVSAYYTTRILGFGKKIIPMYKTTQAGL
jgi:hypothetical protein